MNLAILGCGPSGLIARHAAERARDRGWLDKVAVYSNKKKSAIYGAQYLHKPIPDVPELGWEQSEPLSYKMVGDPEDYLKKVYGPVWDGSISDDLRDQQHLAWDLRYAYDWLWGTYGGAVVNGTFPTTAKEQIEMGSFMRSNYDLVINTVPRPALCYGNHQFYSTDIYAIGSLPGETWPMQSAPMNTVLYNGDKETAFYRLANIFGHHTAEWPALETSRKPPVNRVARVRKPLRHNCDCHPRWHHLGRMGRWQNGYLAHDVYWDTIELIDLANRSAS